MACGNGVFDAKANLTKLDINLAETTSPVDMNRQPAVAEAGQGGGPGGDSTKNAPE